MLSPVPIKVNENTYTSWVTWLVVKTILRLFIVQLPLYSIPAYQSYHSKKKSHQNPEANTQLYFSNKTTPQLQGGTNGVLNGLKLNYHRRVYFSLKQRPCPGPISLLTPGAGKAFLFSAWVEVVWLSRREGVNTAVLCQASCFKQSISVHCCNL